MSRIESRGEHVLVLRLGTFREIDCWVRFFSPVRGIETAFAFGGRRSRRRFPGCLDSLNHLRVHLQAPRSGRYLALNEGTLVQRFPHLQHNLRRLGMAVNCIKFLEAAQIGPDQAETVFDLTLKALQVLDSQAEVPAVFPLLFRARLACAYGYAPDLTRCAVCGCSFPQGTEVLFSWQSGQAVCPECRKNLDDYRSLPGQDVTKVQALLQQDPMQWLQAGWPDQGARRLWPMLDSFVQRHTGLVWHEGRFRRV